MSSRTSPGWACLLLVVCLVAVGFHFFGESLTAARTGLPTAKAGLAFQPGHDMAGDQFVLSATVGLFGESGRRWGPPPLLLRGGLASFTPPTPPPDL